MDITLQTIISRLQTEQNNKGERGGGVRREGGRERERWRWRWREGQIERERYIYIYIYIHTGRKRLTENGVRGWGLGGFFIFYTNSNGSMNIEYCTDCVSLLTGSVNYVLL